MQTKTNYDVTKFIIVGSAHWSPCNDRDRSMWSGLVSLLWFPA